MLNQFSRTELLIDCLKQSLHKQNMTIKQPYNSKYKVVIILKRNLIKIIDNFISLV